MSDTFAPGHRLREAPQRVGPLVHLPALLAERGGSLSAVLAGTGVGEAMLSDADAMLSFRQSGAVLARCAAQTATPAFGALLGHRALVADLGALGTVMARASTLGAAMLTGVEVQRVNSRGASVYLHRSGEHLVLGYAIYATGAHGQEQLYQMLVALLARLVAELTDGNVRPVEVLLPMRTPADAGPFLRLFGVPVRFDQTEAGIILPRTALDAPLTGADPVAFERLRLGLLRHLGRAGCPWSEAVRHRMRPLILRGTPVMPVMAAALGLHPRTLARRLAAEGSSFQALLDEVRYLMTAELLQVTSLEIAEVADAMGYAHQASLSAAFRRWSGECPSGWRTSHP